MNFTFINQNLEFYLEIFYLVHKLNSSWFKPFGCSVTEPGPLNFSPPAHINKMFLVVDKNGLPPHTLLIRKPNTFSICNYTRFLIFSIVRIDAMKITFIIIVHITRGYYWFLLCLDFGDFVKTDLGYLNENLKSKGQIYSRPFSLKRG